MRTMIRIAMMCCLLMCCGIFLCFSGCVVPQSEYDKLEAENKRLKTELDECQFGAEKLIARVEKAYGENNYSLAKYNIERLYEKHPESPKNAEFKVLLEKIKKIEKEEQKRIAEEQKKLAEKQRRITEEDEKKAKEQARLANLNNTGMWEITYFVDEFGEPTSTAVMRNNEKIVGTFSNTATEDSPLLVKFLVTDKTDIDIMLYEYAGNNPVKAYSTIKYQVLVQDKDGERIILTAVNYHDRLSLRMLNTMNPDVTFAEILHDMLMKGGTLKFRIVEEGSPTTKYAFDIDNADYYDNAYRLLQEKKKNP